MAEMVVAVFRDVCTTYVAKIDTADTTYLVASVIFNYTFLAFGANPDHCSSHGFLDSVPFIDSLLFLRLFTRFWSMRLPIAATA